MKKTRDTPPRGKFRRKLAAVMDLSYDLSCDFHTPETLRLKFEALRNIGFRQVNIVAPPFPPDNYDYTHAARSHFFPAEWDRPNHHAASFAQFANPMRQAVEMAKNAGLEVHAIFKPYEGGGFFTIPVTHRLSPMRTQVPCLGGATSVADVIATHPDWRVKRRDSSPDDAHLPATRLEFTFLLDELTLVNANGDIRAEYPPISEAEVAKWPEWRAELLVSDDNATYAKLDVTPKIQREIKRIRIADPNGFTLLNSARCLVVTLTGFSISNPFLAVRFHGEGRRLLIPHSMVKAKHGGETLKTTTSPTFRYNPSHTDVFDVRPPIPGDITTCGFEFAETCPNGWRVWDEFGVARGHEPYLRGSLCEAVPGVHAHWLEQIQTLYDYGCEGVEIRLPSHCSGIADFANYGYNDEILEAFQRRFGRPPGKGKRDFLNVMRVRGDFFVMFLEDARSLADQRRRVLNVQLRDCMLRPSLGPSFHENGFWAMIRILPDWHRVVELSDTIILSDYLSDRHFHGDRSQLELPAKRYAKKLGKDVWGYCYLQQGGSFHREFLDEMANDPYVDGLFLYEVVYNTKEDDGILEVINPEKVRVVPKHQQLFKELLA